MGFGSLGWLRLRAGSTFVWQSWWDRVQLPRPVALSRLLRFGFAELVGGGSAPQAGCAFAMAPHLFRGVDGRGFGSPGQLRFSDDSTFVSRSWWYVVWLPGPVALSRWLHVRFVELMGGGSALQTGCAFAMAPHSFRRVDGRGFGSPGWLRFYDGSTFVWRSWGDDVGLPLAVRRIIFNVAGPLAPRLFVITTKVTSSD